MQRQEGKADRKPLLRMDANSTKKSDAKAEKKSQLKEVQNSTVKLAAKVVRSVRSSMRVQRKLKAKPVWKKPVTAVVNVSDD